MVYSLPRQFGAKDCVLATGSESKSTFALLTEYTLYISEVFGNLREPKEFDSFKKAIAVQRRRLKCSPTIIACDLHPEYLSRKYAERLVREQRDTCARTRLSEIQHHHAHIASCMAENGLRGKVIGVAFDGTGYGPDGTVWGGEFLVADYRVFKRAAHLEYVAMPGGDKAVLEPIRMAFSYLYNTYGKKIDALQCELFNRLSAERRKFFSAMIDKEVNSPLTSSAGRLFDAVSSLLGLIDVIRYEGEAAIELEKRATKDTARTYAFTLQRIDEGIIVSFAPMIKAMMSDMRKDKDIGLIARLFHNTLAEAVTRVCLVLRQENGLKNVVLSGGVFQNRLLSEEAKRRLDKAGFRVYTHSRTSCADRGISLGQAVIAAHRRGLRCV